MNNKLHCFILLLMLIITLRCTHDPVLIDPDSLGVYYLEGNVSPNEPNCRVVIGHALPERMPEDLHNVTMICTGGGQSVILTEQDFCVYQDISTTLHVIPGQRYDIMAQTTDGVTLQAHTYVPGEFKLIKTNLPDTLEYIIKGFSGYEYSIGRITEYKPPVITWNPSAHAFVYEIKMDKAMLLSSFSPSSHLPLINDRENSNIYNPDIAEWVQNCIIKITAYDSTYMPYPVSDSLYDLNEQYELINNYCQEWNYKPLAFNDNIRDGIGYFSSWYTITDTLIVRFKKEVVPYENE